MAFVFGPENGASKREIGLSGGEGSEREELFLRVRDWIRHSAEWTDACGAMR